jgi:hypothetical protein
MAEGEEGERREGGRGKGEGGVRRRKGKSSRERRQQGPICTRSTHETGRERGGEERGVGKWQESSREQSDKKPTENDCAQAVNFRGL